MYKCVCRCFYLFIHLYICVCDEWSGIFCCEWVPIKMVPQCLTIVRMSRITRIMTTTTTTITTITTTINTLFSMTIGKWIPSSQWESSNQSRLTTIDSKRPIHHQMIWEEYMTSRVPTTTTVRLVMSIRYHTNGNQTHAYDTFTNDNGKGDPASLGRKLTGEYTRRPNRRSFQKVWQSPKRTHFAEIGLRE